MSEQRLPWMMTAEQAVAIELAAEQYDVAICELLTRTLARLGKYYETALFWDRLMEQLISLAVCDYDEDDPAFQERLRELQDIPYDSRLYLRKQIEVSVDEFINVHLPAAFEEAA